MSATYRVMQVTETGEEFWAYEGSEAQCDRWIEDNEDNYPESTFYVELASSCSPMYGMW